jgi:ABC-type transport system substrate-binding protein
MELNNRAFSIIRKICNRIFITAFLAMLLLLSIVTSFTSISIYAQAPIPPGIKREDVFILDLVTGKPGTPSNFNAWRSGADVGILVAGMNQLCTGSLWYVDTATGEVINGIAAASPEANSDFTI